MILLEQRRAEIEKARERVDRLSRIAGRRAGHTLLDGALLDGSEVNGARLREAALWLDDGPQATRRQLFEALHPNLGDLLQRWWRDPPIRDWNLPHDAQTFRIRELQLFLIHVIAEPEMSEHDFSKRCSGLEKLPMAGLFATSIASGNTALFEACGAAVGRFHDENPFFVEHALRALLLSPEPAGWMLVDDVLRACRTRDAAHLGIVAHAIGRSQLGASIALIRSLLDQERLFKTPAVVASAGGWLGVMWRKPDVALARQMIEHFVDLLDDPVRAEAIVASAPGPLMQVALVACARRDRSVAIDLARRHVADEDPERRLAASHLLSTGCTAEDTTALMADSDWRVARNGYASASRHIGNPEVLAGLIDLAGRLPDDKVILDPMLLERRSGLALVRDRILQVAMDVRGTESLDFMLDFLDRMGTPALQAFHAHASSDEERSDAVDAFVARLAPR